MTIQISLPTELHEFVESQVGEGRYANATEYLGELIREDERRKAQDHLEELVEEGLRSGPPVEMLSSEWSEIREEGARLLAARRAIQSA